MYKLTHLTSILRLRDNACIPADPANTDYREYLEWVDAGNTPQAADPITPQIPHSVTMRQARQQLFIDGLLSSVDPAIASLPSPQKELAQIEWDKSQTVERDRPLVQQLGAALGLNDEQLDTLFINASKL
jgi:hypothetical protein